MPPLRGAVDSPVTFQGFWQLSGEGTQPASNRILSIAGHSHRHQEHP
jgi:hypothetical protein